jgi:hypothetical protein
MKKMNRTEFEMLLLEEQVAKAIEDERLLQNVIFKKRFSTEDAEKENWCQGVTDNVARRIWAIFKSVKRICFLPCDKEKRHVVLLVQGEENYIVDGTIRQFLPDIPKKVFKQQDYPLKIEEVQTWERNDNNAVLQLTPKKQAVEEK